jgi:hypothetical protein
MPAIWGNKMSASSALNTEIAYFSKTLVSAYESWCQNQEEQHCHPHCYENLRPETEGYHVWLPVQNITEYKSDTKY